MRSRFNTQMELDFTKSNLKITNEYYEKYNHIFDAIKCNPEIIKAVHNDFKESYGAKKKKSAKQGHTCTYTSESIFKMLIVKHFEDLSYRDTVIRIDDSDFLRRFVGILNGKMFDHTALCKMAKTIQPRTWTQINDILTQYAIVEEKITGNNLRRDTTVYEANIHYPTDSHLLWDTYRVLSRFVGKVRDSSPEIVGAFYLQVKEVKKLYMQINRKAKNTKKNDLKKEYEKLVDLTQKLVDFSDDLLEEIRELEGDYTSESYFYLFGLLKEFKAFPSLGRQVINQTTRRVFKGESVPNAEKIFSIFEPHVELIKKGKAGKPVEFGHIVNIQQVKEKFITGYEVFEEKPVEHELVTPTIELHRATFDSYPDTYSDDKGGYESMEKIKDLEEIISVVSIGKKGRRNEEEQERESTPEFKEAQKFRAGIEGSISYLKRMFGLGKCYYRSLKTYMASVGLIVFCHNLTVLSRL